MKAKNQFFRIQIEYVCWLDYVLLWSFLDYVYITFPESVRITDTKWKDW
jgi:hypothetical protein